MDNTIVFIIVMLEMNGFDSFEAWFGHPKLKQVIMFCLLRYPNLGNELLANGRRRVYL